MRLSLSGFLFEDDYSTQSVGFAEFCEIARCAGYEGVELRRTQIQPDTPKAACKELLAIVRDAGLGVTCLTARGIPSSGDERDRFFHRYLDLCGDLQCDLLKIGGDKQWLRQAATIAQEQNVTLAQNNHVGGPLETVAGTRQHFQQINHSNVMLLYDSMHMNVAGEDYVRCIEELVRITRNILVHSVRPATSTEQASIEREGKRWATAMPNEPGVQNWPAIMNQYKRLGYDGLITVIESGWPQQKRRDVAIYCGQVIRRLWNAR